MTLDEWRQLAGRMIAWWPASQFDEATAAVWFEDLQRFDADAVMEALERLKLQGDRFCPSLGELLRELDGLDRPQTPSLREALRMIERASRIAWGPNGPDEQATVGLLANHNLVVARFAARYGVKRLAQEPVDDPVIGGAVLRRLDAEWQRNVEEAERERRDGTARDLTAARLERLGRGDGPRKLNAADLMTTEGET